MSPMTKQVHLNGLIALLLWLSLVLIGHQVWGWLRDVNQERGQFTTARQSLEINAGPPALLLLNTDGLVTTINGGVVTLTARVRDAQGKPVADVMVGFQSHQGTVTPATAQTDAAGAASVTFTAGATVGQALVTATAGAFTQDATIQIVSPNHTAARTLALDLDKVQIPIGQQTAMTIQLRDAAGHPVGNELVTFFGALGTVSPTSAVTDANGRATARFQAGRIAGQGLITALAGAATHSASIQVGERVIPPPAEADHALYLPLVSR